MKIVLVITGLKMGGAENLVVSMADNMVEKGHQVLIIYLTGESVVLPKKSDVSVVPINMKGYIDFIPSLYKVFTVLKKYDPDVVHSHMVHANIFCRILRIFTKIPKLICTAHNTNEGGRARMYAYRLTDYLADISTNVSDEAVEQFVIKKAVKPGRMISVTNGIDTKKFKFSRSSLVSVRKELEIGDKKFILAVGRLNVQKDYYNLLKSIHILNESRSDFKLFIVGVGPLENDLKKYVINHNLSEVVSFLGIRHDVNQLMSAADVFVLSSQWEGLPLVVGEAMASSCFVVATDCGGVKELLGDNGYIVSKNSPDELAVSLHKSLSLPPNTKAISNERARERIINHYSLDKTVDEYIAIYER